MTVDLASPTLGGALGDREAEEAGADDDEIGVSDTGFRTRVELLTWDAVGQSTVEVGTDPHSPRGANGPDHIPRLGPPAADRAEHTTAAAISHGLSRTSAFSPYRKWTTKRFRYM